MTGLNQIYKCNICGNMVEVVHTGRGELVCCGKPMVQLVENTVDAAKEKHVPVIERDGNLVTIRVGSIPHPMIDTHSIEWIELIADGRVQRKYLQPGDPPEAKFLCDSEQIGAREYCNLHGLWKA